MPTRTPAERERLEKKHKREKMFAEIAFIVAIAVFVIIFEFTAPLNCNNEEALATPEPTEEDPRVSYMRAVGIEDYVIGDDAVRAALNNALGFDDQIIVSYKNGMHIVTCRATLDRLTILPSGYSPLFSGVDRPPKESELREKLTAVSDAYSRYFLPLFKGTEEEQLSAKLLSALTEVYGSVDSGDSAETEFIHGVYTVTVKYDDAAKMLTISAEPSS